MWYHLGIRGFSSDIDTTCDALAELFALHACDKVVHIGTSSGGYAALLVGLLMGAQEVHAFAPPTFIDLENRRTHEDFRLMKFVDALYRSPRAQCEYFDLYKVIANRSSATTRLHIYYSSASSVDRLHAERLAEFDTVTLHAIEGTHHNVVRELVRTRQLRQLLDEALG